MLHPSQKPLNWCQSLSVPKPVSLLVTLPIQSAQYCMSTALYSTVTFKPSHFSEDSILSLPPLSLSRTPSFSLYTENASCEIRPLEIPYPSLPPTCLSGPTLIIFVLMQKKLAFCWWRLILGAVFLIPSALISLDTSSRGSSIVLLSFPLLILYPANLQMGLLEGVRTHLNVWLIAWPVSGLLYWRRNYWIRKWS